VKAEPIAAAALVASFACLTACGPDERQEEAAWTIGQAESIGTVRGMRVRAPDCRGHGRAMDGGAAGRYRHLTCVAGARRPTERFDSVAVLYVIRPTGPCCSDYELARVRFIGGPGIP
jgi:hypothetical protein